MHWVTMGGSSDKTGPASLSLIWSWYSSSPDCIYKKITFTVCYCKYIGVASSLLMLVPCKMRPPPKRRQCFKIIVFHIIRLPGYILAALQDEEPQIMRLPCNMRLPDMMRLPHNIRLTHKMRLLWKMRWLSQYVAASKNRTASQDEAASKVEAAKWSS